MREDMLCVTFVTLLVLTATASAQDTYQCNALTYAQPGFRSNRRLYPPDKHDPRVWEDMHKVAFQKSDCTWLAANFKDTGSSFVALLFAGFTQHKATPWHMQLATHSQVASHKYTSTVSSTLQEDWPQPELALYLANSHGLSSLAVDPAGRGESCGYEYGPGYECLVSANGHKLLFELTSTATHRFWLQVSDMTAAAQFINSLPGRYAGALFGTCPAANLCTLLESAPSLNP